MTSNYWKKRQDALMAGLDKKDEKFSEKLAKEYDRLQSELEKEIAYYYQKYGADDILEYRTMMAELSDSERDEIFKDFDSFVQNHPEHANLLPIRQNIYKLNRLEGLQMSVRMKMAELGLIEQDLMTEYLKTSYKYGYESTMKNLKNTSSFFSINNSLLQQALSDKWFNEKNYSDRIWDNKDTLRNWLTNDLKDGIISGKNYDAMVKSLMHRVDTGKFYAKRLVWTESAFFMNTANAHAFMEDGILRYQYTSIIDDRTSKTCRKLNKQYFEFKDYRPGLNAPPMHSFCRSTIVPIENDVVIDDERQELNENIASKLSPEAISRYNDTINNMPPDIASLWSKFGDQLNLHNAKSKSGYYDPSSKGVYMNIAEDLKGSNIHNPLQVFFHEFGHHIDDLAYSKDGLASGKVILSNNKTLGQTVFDEVTSTLKGISKDEGIPIREARWKMYDELQRAYQENPRMMASVSDLFGGATKNVVKYRVGHSTGYWEPYKSKVFKRTKEQKEDFRNQNLGAEAFAEFTDAKSTNKESLDYMKKWLPNSYKAYTELVSKILKG